MFRLTLSEVRELLDLVREALADARDEIQYLGGYAPTDILRNNVPTSVSIIESAMEVIDGTTRSFPTIILRHTGPEEADPVADNASQLRFSSGSPDNPLPHGQPGDRR